MLNTTMIRLIEEEKTNERELPFGTETVTVAGGGGAGEAGDG